MHLNNYICIVSPYPGAGVYLDGWMSRIKTVDLVFGSLQRCYVDFQEWVPPNNDPIVVYSDSQIVAYQINPNSEKHKNIVGLLFKNAKFVYIHTIHQCAYMLDYFDPQKMLVDIHGIVPEEEEMMGSRARSELYGKVEEEILKLSTYCSVVTKAMIRHYNNKYPALNLPDFIHVPVFDYGSLNSTTDRIDEILLNRQSQSKIRTIYAGGSQVWQRADLMLSVIKQTTSTLEHEIYTHNIEEFHRKIIDTGMDISILKGNVSKGDLMRLYNKSSFGFALREDNIVNRVACPTKICDYCANMVIPIIAFPEIGDFCSYGYEFINLEDLVEDFIPDFESQRWMVQQNLKAMEFMFNDFRAGAEKVLNLAVERLI